MTNIGIFSAGQCGRYSHKYIFLPKYELVHADCRFVGWRAVCGNSRVKAANGTHEIVCRQKKVITLPPSTPPPHSSIELIFLAPIHFSSNCGNPGKRGVSGRGGGYNRHLKAKDHIRVPTSKSKTNPNIFPPSGKVAEKGRL